MVEFEGKLAAVGGAVIGGDGTMGGYAWILVLRQQGQLIEAARGGCFPLSGAGVWNSTSSSSSSISSSSTCKSTLSADASLAPWRWRLISAEASCPVHRGDTLVLAARACRQDGTMSSSAATCVVAARHVRITAAAPPCGPDQRSRGFCGVSASSSSMASVFAVHNPPISLAY